MATTTTAMWDSDLTAPTRRDRKPCEYSYYLPDELLGWDPNLNADIAADIADGEKAISNLNAQSIGSSYSLEGIARFLLRAESVGSSKIEGLQISAKRLARHEAAVALGGTSSDYTAAEILASVAQMETAIKIATDTPELTVNDICEMHRVLMIASPTPELAGKIRDKQNWIGGSNYNPCGAAYVPPPPEHVTPLLEDLVRYLNGDNHPALMQAAIVHAQFETIHPFIDGNGRTGRALIHAVLIRRGLVSGFVPPISLILATSAKSYISALTRFRHTDEPNSAERSESLNDLLRLFAGASILACETSRDYSTHISELQDNWKSSLGTVRSDSAAISLIELLPGTPILTVESAMRLTGKSRPAASKAIDKLVAAEVLQQRNLGKQRYRVYEASEAIELYDSLERALATPMADSLGGEPIRPTPRRPS